MSLKFIIFVTFLVIIDYSIASERKSYSNLAPETSSSSSSNENFEETYEERGIPVRSEQDLSSENSSSTRKSYPVECGSAKTLRSSGKGIQIHDNPQEGPKRKSRAQVRSKKEKEPVSKPRKHRVDKSLLTGPISRDRPFSLGERLSRQFDGHEPVIPADELRDSMRMYNHPEKRDSKKGKSRVISRRGKQPVSEEHDTHDRNKEEKSVQSHHDSEEMFYPSGTQGYNEGRSAAHAPSQPQPGQPAQNLNQLGILPHPGQPPQNLNQFGMPPDAFWQPYPGYPAQNLHHPGILPYPGHPPQNLNQFGMPPDASWRLYPGYPAQNLHQSGILAHPGYPAQNVPQSGILPHPGYPAQNVPQSGILPHPGYPAQNVPQSGILPHPRYPAQNLNQFGVPPFVDQEPRQQLSHLRVLTREPSIRSGNERVPDPRQAQTARLRRPPNEYQEGNPGSANWSRFEKSGRQG